MKGYTYMKMIFRYLPKKKLKMIKWKCIQYVYVKINIIINVLDTWTYILKNNGPTAQNMTKMELKIDKVVN